MSPQISRRAMMQLTGAAAASLATIGPALGNQGAAPTLNTPTERSHPDVVDMGPGSYAFPLMSALLVGDRFYIGSRNLEPTRAIAYDPATGEVTGDATFGPGDFVQALAHDQDADVLYAGIVKAPKGKANIYAWDLGSDEVREVAAIDELKAVRAVAVGDDGTVYATGRERSDDGPGLYAIDPESGSYELLARPDDNATQARGLAVLDDRIFLGAGSNLSGGGDASPASLWVIDRDSGDAESLIPDDAPFSEDPATRDLAVIGDRLYIGTEGAGDHAWFAWFSLEDYSLQFSEQAPFKSVKKIIEADGKVWFDADGLNYYDPETDDMVKVDGGEALKGWGLGHYDGQIIGASADAQAVGHYDLDTGEITSHDLIEGGAPGDAELGMSVAAGGGYAFVGGNGSVSQHNDANSDISKVLIASETKDALVLDGAIIAAVYSSQGIWRYDPATGDDPKRIIELPQEQNRPQSVAWDSTTSRFLVGLQADTVGGGSLAICDLDAKKAEVEINPLDDQMVRAVTSKKGYAYIGGDDPEGPRPDNGHLACWDIKKQKEIWRIDPDMDGVGINSVAVQGNRLFAITLDGDILVVNRHDGEIETIIDRTPETKGRAVLVATHGRVFGASPKAVFRVDPHRLTLTNIVEDLDAQWYSGPRLSADERGNLYTLRERNLIRVEQPFLA